MKQKSRVKRRRGFGGMKSKSFVFLAWIVLGLVIFGGASYGLTVINDQGISSTGPANVSNLFYGSSNGPLNYTFANRAITSNGNTTVTVCSVGCNFTSIQAAVNNAPLIIRHPYIINIYDGTYNESVYIPPVIGSFSSLSEGSVGALRINGNLSNYNAVKVNSFQISGAIGAIAVKLRGMQITGREPTSDENTSISVYGSRTVELQDINFTASVDYGFLAYGSSVNGNRLYFTGNQLHAAQAKNMGNIIFGDSSGGNSNNGSVISDLVKSDDGSYIFIQANGVSSSNLVQPNGRGFVIDSDNFNLYNVGTFARNMTFSTLTDIFANDTNNYALEVKNFATNGRAIRTFDNSGTATMIITSSQMQILGNFRFSLQANSSSKSCTAGSAGDIYYDGSLNKHFGCNSTAWNALY